MKILHLIPSLGISGAARQLQLLVKELDQDALDIRTAVLDGQQTTFDVQASGVVRLTEPSRRGPWAWWNLRTLLNHWQPDLIHVWKLPTLRGLALIAPGLLHRVVLSQPFDWARSARFTSLDRWLLRRVARIVVGGDAEARLAKHLGLFLEKITQIPPGVDGITVDGLTAEGVTGQEATQAVTPAADEDPRIRRVVCIGPLSAHKGFRDAVWGFDVLKYVYPWLRLVVVGEGPAIAAMNRFAVGVNCQNEVEYVGNTDRAGVARQLRRADYCWIPSARGGGTNAALEAMMAGLPVVACRVPNLDGIIIEGKTGLYVDASDPIAFSKRTRSLLHNPELAKQLGAAAQEHARKHFAPRQLAQRFRRLYSELAA